MYLAGLVADDSRMTVADLQQWVRRAVSDNISEYTVPDDKLDIALLRKILDRVVATIHTADACIRGKMNAFVIAPGSYVAPLTDEAIAAAEKIGVVQYTRDGTACTPPPTQWNTSLKVKNKGAIGKKKKEVKC